MSRVPWRGKQRGNPRGETSPLMALRDEMDRLLDTYVREPMGAFEWPFGDRPWLPPVDLGENDEEVIVRMETPGIAPEDIQITVSGGQLVLSGEKKVSTEQGSKDFYQTESRYGTFRRAIPLPESIDAERIDAEYHNGVLTVRLHKSGGAPPKRVEVKVKP